MASLEVDRDRAERAHGVDEVGDAALMCDGADLLDWVQDS